MANLDDKNKNKELVEQQQALSNYLDALFREMPAGDEPEAEPAAAETVEAPVEVSPPPAVPKPFVAPAPAVEPPPRPVAPQAKPAAASPPPVAEARPTVPQLMEQHLVKQLAKARAAEQPVQQPVQQVESLPAAKPQSPPPPEQPAVYQPDSEFQVLFFRLGKLNLAVPLEHLAGILKIGDETITKVPGYADWHMGLMKNQGVTVNVLDTAKLILPSHHQHVVEEQEPYRFYILLDGKRWGLACHSVAEVVTLQPDEVKWRQVRKLQPWLAGTVIDKMCALLDVEGFLKMLQQHRRGTRR